MTRSQKEYIDDCFNHESNDPESQEWRETLTEEERAYVADKDERYRVGMLRLAKRSRRQISAMPTNNVIERLYRKIRRRTRVVGCFPDGNSALMLVCARLRHVAGTQWGNKKYMNMNHLEAAAEDASIAG